MSTHDENGPSSLLRRALCPGSAQEERGRTEQRNEDTEAGTSRHNHMARLLRIQDTDVRATTLLALPAEDQELVGMALAIADSVRFNLRADHPTAERIDLVEYQVDLSHMGIPKGGTLDFAVVVPGVVAVIVDWKFGAQPADHPRYSWQMKAYAVGIARAFGVRHVDAVVCQPTLAGGERERTCGWDIALLEAMEAEIAGIVRATQDPQAPRIPSERACQWCRAKATCPARQRVAAEVIAMGDPVASIRALAPAERTRQYQRLSLAIEVLEKAQAAVDDEILAGRLEIPGYAVGEGKKGNREWKDDAAAEAYLRRTLPDPDSAVSRKVVTPTQAEKLLGKSRAAEIAAMVTQKSGKPAVVRA